MSFKYIKIFTSLVFLQLLVAPYLKAEEDQPSIQDKSILVFGQGEQRLLRVSSLLKYSIGSPIVRAIALPANFEKRNIPHRDHLLLKAVSPGNTDIWIWKQDGTTEHRAIRVEKVVHESKNLALERALSHLDETEVIFSGQSVVLRGKVYTLKESSKLAAIAQGFPKEVRDETELADSLLDYAQTQLNQWLMKSNYRSSLRIERLGQGLWIRGSLNRPSEHTWVLKQIRSIFPLIQTEIDSLPDHSPTVYFRVFLLELKRSEFHSLGLSWPSSVQGAFQVTLASVQNLLQIDLTLQQLENRGSARVLSNPELVVRAPGEAELFAGGEIPIQIQNRYYSNVSWKNYGLTLRLKVTHTSGEKVRLDIFTEVSHLDQHIAQDKIPGIQSNRMKTQVDARYGTPLLLSGLLQQGMREEAKGIPFLRGIPVLGLLFGSEDYLNERSELVAILYPYNSPPPAPVEKVQSLVPKGPIPFPRDWVNPQEERALKESHEYPWNVLQ